MHTEKKPLKDELILQAVADTRSQWIDLLEEQEAEDLTRWLAQKDTRDPETRRRVVNRLLDLLQKYPEARTHVTDAMGIKGTLEQFRFYSPMAGEPAPPSSILLVCPEDPDHYRKHIVQKGRKYFCPEHGVPLVPADSIEPKE
jgi:hypothetical protein